MILMGMKRKRWDSCSTQMSVASFCQMVSEPSHSYGQREVLDITEKRTDRTMYPKTTKESSHVPIRQFHLSIPTSFPTHSN